MVNKVIDKISEQQKGKENTAVFMVGEQLKDICKENPNTAEMVLQDLENKEMSIEECEKEIKKYADSQRKSGINCVCVSPAVAEDIICKFYGINKEEKQSSGSVVSLMDLM